MKSNSTNFPTRPELRQHLRKTDQPNRKTFALRCALRVLPLTVNQVGDFPSTWEPKHLQAVLGAIWLVAKGPDTKASAANANANAKAAADAANAGYGNSKAAACAAYAAAHAGHAANDAYAAANAAANAAAAADAATGSRRQFTPPADPRHGVLRDLELMKQQNLLDTPLWPGLEREQLVEMLEPWHQAVRRMSKECSKQESKELNQLASEVTRLFLSPGKFPAPAPDVLARAIAHVVHKNSEWIDQLQRPAASEFTKSRFEISLLDELIHQPQAYSNFTPDPLWLAWYQVNHPQTVAWLESVDSPPEKPTVA